MEFEAIFDHFVLRTEMGESRYEEEAYLRPYRLYNRRWKVAGPVFTALQSLMTRASQPREIAFVGMHFDHLITQTVQEKRIALFDAGLTRLFVRQNAISNQPVWRERFELHRIYMNFREQKTLDHQAVERVISGFERRLRQQQVKSLVLWNDVMFVERCMILAARRIGIPSFVIQHGLYMSDQADARIIGGNWADYVLTWGEFFTEMFVKAGIAPRDRVRLLGYPRPFDITPPSRVSEPPMICVLGQDWECYGADLELGKRRFTQNLIDASVATEMSLVYRPHPSESRAWIQTHFPQVNLTPAGETLIEAFGKYDVFISLTSTALVEASMYGKIALELIDPAFVQDDFAQIGACHSRPNTVEAIEAFLSQVQSGGLEAFSVHERYVWVPPNLAGRLMQIIERTLSHEDVEVQRRV
jgi:hypothetical protein